MKKLNLKIFAVLLSLLLVMGLALAGCGKENSGDTDSTDDVEVEVTIYDTEGTITLAAAASLEKTFTDELIPLFNERYPNVTFVPTYDSSGKLQTQIEEGLAADVFFSAATKQMTALVDGGYIDSADVTELLENELVLITRKDSGTSVTDFDNITDAATIAIGDPASVPAGQYAQEALTSLGTWDAVSAKASLGTNVTEVLNWVAEGSAEVGIVYATDAASVSDKVEVIAKVPEGSLQTPVIYPVAKLKAVSADNAEAVDAFIDFLKSDEVAAIFEKAGFKVL
ncbi:MAG: molybdate ABC transporter substrate-binding protein [Clostridiales Family XIII bacterium]|jgi:molybdate transport system substrate-binding protein|nr:molybdate ABC transporter substrate-binding protein [Clostridiales Family XIII bacterium]